MSSLFSVHTQEVASKVNVVMEVMDPQQRGMYMWASKYCVYGATPKVLEYILQFCSVIGYITIEHFMTFMHTISEEQLSKALSFTILPIGGLQSEQDSVRSDDS